MLAYSCGGSISVKRLRKRQRHHKLNNFFGLRRRGGFVGLRPSDQERLLIHLDQHRGKQAFQVGERKNYSWSSARKGARQTESQ